MNDNSNKSMPSAERTTDHKEGGGASVTLGEGVVRIESFSTRRKAVVAAFEVEDQNSYFEFLDSILEIGASAHLHAGARVDLEQLAGEVAHLTEGLEKEASDVKARLSEEFAQCFSGLEEQIENIFGDGGKLKGLLVEDNPEGVVARLTEALREETKTGAERLARLLDPTFPGSVLSVLHHQVNGLSSSIEQLRIEVAAQLAGAAAKAEEAERGTAKGRNFEIELASALRNIAKPHADLVDYVGDNAEIGGRKVGDFVSTLSPRDSGASEARIVIEAKDARIGLVALRRELVAAREKRGAAAAIGVYASEKLMPQGAAPITELSPLDFAVLYDPETGDEDALRLAYRFARIVVLSTMRNEHGGSLDEEALRVDLTEAKDILGSIARMTGQITKLENGVTEGLGEVKANLVARSKRLLSLLERMESRLAEPGSDPRAGRAA